MGLFKWLVVKLAGALGQLPHQRVRKYKVTLLGDTVGTFTLPLADHLADPQTYARPILCKPFLVDMPFAGGDGFYYLYWAERYPDGRFKTVTWHPPTPELREEAKRFFDAAHGLLPDGRPDPAKQPPLPTRTVEETRLISAVLADPDAELPYLDYASWLTSKSDAYGDYIRLTWEMEKLPEGDKRRERLEERRGKIVQKYGPEWVLPLANLGLFPGVHIGDVDGYWPDIWHGKKGVIEELDIPSDARVFPASAARLFYGAPLLRKLSINNLDITVADVGVVPQMRQIESLSLSVGAGTPEDFRRFAESPHLGGLRELKLSGYRFGPVAAAHLAQAKWLAGVRSLDVSTDAIGDDGAEALAASPSVANLRVLELGHNNLTDRGLVALCRSPHFANLTTLSVWRGDYTPAGIAAIPTATFAQNLTSIELSDGGLDLAGAQALAAGNFPALRRFAASANEYYLDDGSLHAPQPCGEAALRALVAAPWFRTLESFTAAGAGFTDACATALAALGFLPLRELFVGGNRLTDAGVTALVRSKAATRLTKLSLSDSPFGTAGAKAIAETDLPALEELDLTRVNIGRTGAQALAASPHLKNLKKLGVSEEFVGLVGREALVKRFTDQVVSCY